MIPIWTDRSTYETMRVRKRDGLCVCCGGLRASKPAIELKCGCRFCDACKEKGHAMHAGRWAVPCPEVTRLRLYCECKGITCRSHGGPDKPCRRVGRFSSCRVRVNRRPDDMVMCMDCRDNLNQAKEA